MLVSCLMPMLPAPGRLDRQRRAIENYLAQTHGERELVVVIDRGAPADRAAAAAMIAGFDRPDIRVLLPEGEPTLGALRNLSVAEARGEILCQWDDDDLHHPDRIGAQLDALRRSRRDATILEDVLLYREAEAALFWTRWTRTPAGGHPATLLCARNAGIAYPESGPEASRGEDLAALAPLIGSGRLHRQADAPHLYVYVSHEANTAGAAHHALLAERLAISTGLLRRREAALRAALAGVDFCRPVEVRGANGPAFSL